jgi:hypothetical protein
VLPGVVIAVALSAPVPADVPQQVFDARIKPWGAAAAYLEAMEVLNVDGRAHDPGTTLERNAGDTIRINLGLGETVSKRIRLIPRPGVHAQFTLEQQHQTSLTVMDDGPHMDLRGWRHHVSDWMPVETSGPLAFVTRDTISDDFPAVTTRQIVAAVEAESRRWAAQGHVEVDRWVRLAKGCTGATTYPCGVVLSEVRWRIRVEERGRWKTIQTVELVIPMGC